MRRTCLQPDELQQVIEGRLSQEEFDSAVSHLDSCETCRTAVETLENTAGGARIDHVTAESSDAFVIQNETACHIALQDLLKGPSPASPAVAPPPFEMLGPYRLLELIGSGGMGAVYLAEHQRLRRQCAIKLLPPDRVSQPGWLDRFDREMTTIASLEHPNIVRATDAGHESGWHYLVMEHLDGLDIGRVAQRMGQLEVPDACEIVRQAALGLLHIHESGLVHRDIKPSNLMLTRSGKIKLLDLGLVLDGDDPLSKDDRLTTVGHVMGTMPYMAPEQLADSRDVRPQSDVYSLGATLYRLIAGHPPHQGGRGLASQVLAITSHDARPLDCVREDVDRDVVSLVATMLDRNPANRPQSAAEVAEQLAAMNSNSRLQRLLRNAMKKRGDEFTEPTMMPSVRAGGGANHSGTLGRWIAGGLFASLIFVAAIVFKIQTDVGDLVIHSDENDLTLVIKQNDKVVDRLILNQGDSNRKTLYKGTYKIEIEGGSQALVLSDEVVTIGRGTEQEIDVAKKDTFGLDGGLVSSGDPRMLDAAGVNAAAPTPAERAGLSNQESNGQSNRSDARSALNAVVKNAKDDLVFNGKSIDEWLTLLEKEETVEGIGTATFGVIGACQIAEQKGVANVDMRQRLSSLGRDAVDLILHRAREFGGLESTMPPLGVTDESSENDSAYFMWYLSEVFAEPNIGAWLTPAVDELVDGNSNSRAAVLYCLHRYANKHLSAGGMGGMGGMGGGYSVPANDVSSKFATSRLIRCCFGLAADNAWPEFDATQRRNVQAMAHEIIMDIHIFSQFGTSEDVYEQLKDSISKVPPNERTEKELQYVPAVTEDALSTFDNTTHTPLAEPVRLSDSPIKPSEGSENLLYQGKDLETWLNTLQRERDVLSIGNAMKAVELLTRDAEDQKRKQAAKQTAIVARRLGGLVVGGSMNEKDPSRSFMREFLDVFVRYFPDPGFEVIADELATDHRRSHMALIFATSNFLNGVLDQAEYPGRVEAVQHWSESAKQQPETVKQVMEVCDLLVSVADDFLKDTKQGSLDELAGNMAFEVAADLMLRMDVEIKENPPMVEYMKRRLEELNQSLEEDPNSGLLYLRGSCVIAAIQLASSDEEFGTDERWQALARLITASHIVFRNENYKSAFQAVEQHAPDALMDSIEVQLPKQLLTATTSNRVGQMLVTYAKRCSDVSEVESMIKDIRTGVDLSQGFLKDFRLTVESAEREIEKRKAMGDDGAGSTE